MKKGWEIKKLGNLTTIKTGKLNANAMVENGDYAFFTCSREVFRIDNYAFDCEAILLAGNNASGDFNVKHYKGKFNAYQRTYVITIDDNDKLLYVYLKYKMEANLLDFKNQSLGANTKFLKIGMIESMPIPIPPLEEQQQIVAFLDEVFEAIEQAQANIEKNIENAKELFQSKLNEIFSQKCDFWEEKTLGELSILKSGGTPSTSNPSYWANEGIAWYSSGELNDTYTQEPERYITNLGLKNSNAKIFPEGSLLIGMYDTAALKMSIIDRDATFNQAIVGVEPHSDIDLKFIMLSIESQKSNILKLRRGVRQKNLNQTKIKAIEIYLPQLSTQKDIVSKIDDFNLQLNKLENYYQKKLNELEELKKSILEKAFAGELSDKDMSA